MKRQKGVWITILCILVIGVSVTKMTSRFVSSGTLETVAYTAAALTEEAGIQTEADQPGMRSRSAASLTQRAAESAALQAETPAASSEKEEESVSTASWENETDGEEASSQTAEPAPAVLAAAPASEEGGGETSHETAGEESVPETVKSPLDPGTDQREPSSLDAGETKDVSQYTSEDFKARLDETDAKISQYRASLTEAAPAASYMAAEYEWSLWDNELNILYKAIRDLMTPEEAEALKQEELEWIRKRDADSDKAAGKSNGSGNRNTAYLEAAARITKERCYELAEDYGAVLDRERQQAERGF